MYPLFTVLPPLPTSDFSDLDEYGFSRTRAWSTGLCSCDTVEDIGVTGFVACCEPCGIAMLAKSLPATSHPLAGRPVTAAAAYVTGTGCCAPGHTRTSFRGPTHYALRMHLRHALAIEGDPWHDMLLTQLCPQLALCQELREVSRFEAVMSSSLSLVGDMVPIPARSVSTPPYPWAMVTPPCTQTADRDSSKSVRRASTEAMKDLVRPTMADAPRSSSFRMTLAEALLSDSMRRTSVDTARSNSDSDSASKSPLPELPTARSGTSRVMFSVEEATQLP